MPVYAHSCIYGIFGMREMASKRGKKTCFIFWFPSVTEELCLGDNTAQLSALVSQTFGFSLVLFPVRAWAFAGTYQILIWNAQGACGGSSWVVSQGWEISKMMERLQQRVPASVIPVLTLPAHDIKYYKVNNYAGWRPAFRTNDWLLRIDEDMRGAWLMFSHLAAPGNKKKDPTVKKTLRDVWQISQRLQIWSSL